MMQPRFHSAVHGTSIAWRGSGVLITGPAGRGKSTLAAMLIARGAALIADDLTGLFYAAACPYVGFPPRADPSLRGRLHLRHRGWRRYDAVDRPLRLGLMVSIGSDGDAIPQPWPGKVPVLTLSSTLSAAARLDHCLTAMNAGFAVTARMDDPQFQKARMGMDHVV